MRLNDLILSFDKSLEEWNATLLDKISYEAYYTGSSRIIKRGIELLEKSHRLSGIHEDKGLEYLHYSWTFLFLDYTILLRDVQLKTSRDYILQLKEVDEKEQNAFFVQWLLDPQITNLLQNATLEIKEELRLIMDKQVEVEPAWYHQETPIPEALIQLGQIAEQKDLIFNSHTELAEVKHNLNNYIEFLLDFTNSRLNRLRKLISYLKETSDIISAAPNPITKVKLNSLSKNIQKASEAIENEKVIDIPYEPFRSAVSQNLVLPIYSNQGEMIYKKINLNKKIESWIENEIFPKIIDADSDINTLYDTSIITLFNSRNKLENLALGKLEEYSFVPQPYVQAIDAKIDELHEFSQDLDQIIHELNFNIVNEISLDHLFSMEKEFLPELNIINFSKITSQRLWYEGSTWNHINSWFKKTFDQSRIPFIQSIGKDVYHFVESKLVEEKDLEINSLFLKKGYLGRSFYVNRQEEENRILGALDRWKKSYKGSVLVTGDFGSGKSCFVEYMPHFLEHEEVIQLRVNSTLKLNGRRHKIDGKLQETFNFLAAQSLNKPLIVCMDEIASWSRNDYSLFEIVADIVDAIGRYGRRLFFIVAVNHYMHQHISRMFDFNSRFSEILRLDKMSSRDIANAIFVRHNASIRDSDHLENAKIVDNAMKIATRCRNNIGASMYAWERFLEEKYNPVTPPPSFGQLIKQHAMILKVLMVKDMVQESQLRLGLTAMDNAFLSEEIRKLLGYKIIYRTLGGNLQMNPYLVHEIEHILRRKKL